MKKIIKKPLWFTVITTLCLAVTLFTAGGCDKDESKHYTLNFAGEGVNIEPQSVAYGKHAIAPENPERDKYGFGGWFTDNGTFTNEWDFKTDIVTQDTTLYAKWEKITLQGTKWKLIGIVDVQTGDLTELEPKDCEKCYTLAFDDSVPFCNELSLSSFFTISSFNELGGCYEIDYKTGNFQLLAFGGTQAGEFRDGWMYADPFWNYTIQSFSLQENELRLYHNDYHDKKKYFLFKRQKS